MGLSRWILASLLMACLLGACFAPAWAADDREEVHWRLSDWLAQQWAVFVKATGMASWDGRRTISGDPDGKMGEAAAREDQGGYTDPAGCGVVGDCEALQSESDGGGSGERTICGDPNG